MTPAAGLLKKITTFERTLLRHATYAPTIGCVLTKFKLLEAVETLRRERGEIEQALPGRKVEAA
jgi:hypothetical protein